MYGFSPPEREIVKASHVGTWILSNVMFTGVNGTDGLQFGDDPAVKIYKV